MQLLLQLAVHAISDIERCYLAVNKWLWEELPVARIVFCWQFPYTCSRKRKLRDVWWKISLERTMMMYSEFYLYRFFY